MKANEKAKELFKKIALSLDYESDVAIKELCTICIDEIISACEYNNVESWNTDWWNKVKQEIEKI
jgi:hypothetical protein